MTKIYIAFYDEDTGAREEWNTFYTPWVAATTREDAQRLAEEKIKKAAAETINDDFDINLNTTAIEDIEDDDLRDEVDAEYHYCIKKYIIEIQEGELL